MPDTCSSHGGSGPRLQFRDRERLGELRFVMIHEYGNFDMFSLGLLLGYLGMERARDRRSARYDGIVLDLSLR